MSYALSLGSPNIKADIIKAGTPTSAAQNGRFTLTGTINGSAYLLTSNRIAIPQGSSYYLEGSVLVQNGNYDGAITWQWYDNTNSTYLGAEGFMNFAVTTGSDPRISRRAACALILASDLSTSIEVELRIKVLTGTGWDMTITATGISSYDFVGYPSVRILEIS